jgi:hypothetical protein
MDQEGGGIMLHPKSVTGILLIMEASNPLSG